MEGRGLASTALVLVSAAQVCYLIGGLSFGFGFGTIASLVLAIAMAVAAFGLRSGDRTVFAWALLTGGVTQVADYAQTVVTGAGPFIVGFTLVTIGAVTCGVSAMGWRRAPVDAPRPRGLRWGAGISCLGAFVYIALNLGNLFSPNLFTLGTIVSLVAWALFALA